jgi:hypothetical protein
MSDAEGGSKSKRGKTVVFLIGVALIAILGFVPVWKCPPCEGSGKVGLLGLDCAVCRTKGRIGAIPTLAQYYWSTLKFRSPVH